MKTINFFALIASFMFLAACSGEQRQENQNNDAPETMQEAPADVYEESPGTFEEPTTNPDDETMDINVDPEGADADINTDEVDVNMDTRTEEDSVNNVE